ncbi:hypothetical protein KJ866_04125 [Patescibacteria group bacterium]|nr:hypothetical protein [Patescibacteria group bacterium]MBU2265260.1 hypothetical protein [Patescibacteria group bacterium]
MEEQDLNQTPTSQKLVISSKKKWLWLGILVAVVNPVFAGLIIGAVYLSEPALQKEGRIIAGIAILWGAVLFYLISKSIVANPFAL